VANAPFHVYAKGLVALGAKLENLPSDALKCALLSSYTVGSTLATAEFVSDVITGGVGVEVAAGGGYTTGGVALSSVTWAATIANSWPVTAATSTAYNVGDIVKPSGGNTFLYQAVVAGTSGGSAPAWPVVVGTTVADGGVTWLNIGTAVTVLGSANIVFTSSGGGFTAAFGLLYDSTPGSAGTNPVIGYYDFGGSLSPSAGGTLTITVPASGILPFGSS
jgi:hypothetical protein